MKLGWLETILYGLISGITEFIPVSSGAHRALLQNIFGATKNMELMDLLIHFGVLFALLMACKAPIHAIQKTKRLLTIPKRRRKRQPDPKLVALVRFTRAATIPAVLLAVLFLPSQWVGKNHHIIALLLLINGIALYIPSRLSTGNKDARFMNGFAATVTGLSAGLGIFPGISGFGGALTATRICGADPEESANWCLLLWIPVLISLCIVDAILIYGAGLSYVTFAVILKCLLAGIFSYIGAFMAIMAIRFMAVKTGFSFLSYYCWGLALFMFILYMI